MAELESDWVLTQHVLDRYREFYPGASKQHVMQAAAASLAINVDIGLRLVGRSRRPDGHRGEFLLHPERTGLFLLVEESEADHLVTFLRFYSERQHELALRLFGEGEPVTASGALYASAGTPASEDHFGLDDLDPQTVGITRTLRSALGAARLRQWLACRPTPQSLTSLEQSCFRKGCAPVCAFPYFMGKTEVRLLLYREGSAYILAKGVSAYSKKQQVTDLSLLALKQAKLPWLPEVEIRSVRVCVSSLPASILPAGSEPEQVTSVVWAVRRALLMAAVEEEVEGGYRLCLTVGGKVFTAWLNSLVPYSKNSLTEWHLCPGPPAQVTSVERALAEKLHVRGWLVRPPLWEGSPVEG